MTLFGRNRNRITTDETEALHHLTRLRILEIHAHDRWERLIPVEELTEALVKTPGFEHTKPDEVNYHRARLLDAELLPSE